MGPQGGTLIFSYIRRLESIFWGQNFEFQYIFWGVFRKMINFLGIKILWIFFWGHHKIGLYLGIISMHFRAIFKVKVQNGGYFLGLLKFQIFFWGCLKFLIFFFFWVNGLCWARSYVCRKNESPPWAWGMRGYRGGWVPQTSPMENHKC